MSTVSLLSLLVICTFCPRLDFLFFSACYYIWPQSGDVAHFALALISAIWQEPWGRYWRLLRTPTKDASYSSLHLGAVTSAPSFICGPPPSSRLRSEWSIPVPPPLSYYRCSLAAYIYMIFSPSAFPTLSLLGYFATRFVGWSFTGMPSQPIAAQEKP